MRAVRGPSVIYGRRPEALIASGNWARRMLAARRAPILGVAFLIWTARNLLKSPESGEGIQDNPSPFSWSGLVWIWLSLGEFGLRRSADGVGRRATLPSGWRPEMEGKGQVGLFRFTGRGAQRAPLGNGT